MSALLVAPDSVWVERYARGEGGVWSLREGGADATLVLASIDCEIAVEEIYLKVFPAPV